MSTTGNSFMAALERKLNRARKMIDKVDDPAAYKAMDALYGVFEAMLADATPQVVVMEMPDGKKPKAVKPEAPESAGEKIAHAQNGQYL